LTTDRRSLRRPGLLFINVAGGQDREHQQPHAWPANLNETPQYVLPLGRRTLLPCVLRQMRPRRGAGPCERRETLSQCIKPTLIRSMRWMISLLRRDKRQDGRCRAIRAMGMIIERNRLAMGIVEGGQARVGEVSRGKVGVGVAVGVRDPGRGPSSEGGRDTRIVGLRMARMMGMESNIQTLWIRGANTARRRSGEWTLLSSTSF
jgi:hypothetical protein